MQQQLYRLYSFKVYTHPSTFALTPLINIKIFQLIFSPSPKKTPKSTPKNEIPFLHLQTLQMSIPTTVLPILPTTSTPPPPISTVHSLSSLGLGYAIAIALAFLVILSTFLIASYLCRRRHSPSHNPPNQTPNTAGIMLPSIIFVAEDGSPNRSDSPSGVVGLDQSVINSYPKFQFSRSGVDLESESAVCSICLCDYKDGEMLRMMPDCRHSFHLYCLDAWLRLNGSCPVCRNSPLPTPVTTPMSTPLAEVVPLTQFADNRRRR